MKTTNKTIKNILSITLCLVMLFNLLAVVGSATIDENNLCEHHPEHTEDCGYVEGESECTYSCEECTVIIKPTIASGTSEWTTNPEPEMVSVAVHSEYDISWYTNDATAETFYIDDVADLVGLMFLVNYGPDGVWDSENELFTDGSSTSDNVTFEGKTIELRSDLKLNGDYNVLDSDGKLDLTNVNNLKKWKPIGAGYKYFKGTFDGKEYTISGIYMPLVKDTYTVDSALFGRLSGATIKNVKITDSYLYGSSKYKSSDVYVGGLVAHMTKSTVDNCTVDARIICDCPDISTRYQNAGGVVGYVSSGSDGNTVISNCVFNGDIVANVTSVGGILGRTYDSASAMIENCINNGYIENNVYRDFSGIGTGAYFATAGIFGYGAAKIKNCINYGTVKGMRSYIAGIAGKPTSVENCKNLGTVTQVDTCITPEKGWYVYIGGIVAECSSVTNCVNGSPEDSTLGNITAIAYCGNMGGIAAVSHGDVTGCVNYAPIKDDTSKYVENRTSFYSLGGIVGYMSPLKVDIAITDCVNYGDITGSGEGTTYYKAEKVAGILGDIQISNSASYYGNVTISECINKGDITSPNHAAGINGYNYTSDNSTYKGRFYITNCYNTGDIFSTDNTYFSHAGGIIAYNNVANGVGPIVSGVYNIGAVSRGYTSGKAGGVAGYNYGTYTNTYYLDTCVTNPNTTGTAKTLEQFNSGEVAYLLQQGNTEQVWGQDSNQAGATPIFDSTGLYKVVTVGETGNYSVANVGDTNGDGTVDVVDYQALVNKALSKDHEQTETAGYDDIVKYDLDGDGYLDVIDASLMNLLINGHKTVDVYAFGDYDLNGKAFEEADINAIKHAVEKPEKLSTAEKYACDINGDGKVSEEDLIELTAIYGEIDSIEHTFLGKECKICGFNKLNIADISETVYFNDNDNKLDLSTLFTLPDGAGNVTYELLSGAGTLDGSILNIKLQGTEKIKVTVAETETCSADEFEITVTVEAPKGSGSFIGPWVPIG